MRTDLFDFDLPKGRIALHPAVPRDAARLLVIRPGTKSDYEDRVVRDLPDLLRPGDAIVLNDTRVIPAALSGTRMREGANAQVGFTLLERLDGGRWRTLARPAKRLAIGDRLRFGEEGSVCFAGVLDAAVASKGEAGEVDLAFNLHGAYLDQAIAELGTTPLPPYIASRRDPEPRDETDYQTIYASHDGAVAAPTAGLHFTTGLLERLAARTISRFHVTLHVGAGTFLPVKTQDTDQHRMHEEWGRIDAVTAEALNRVRAQGGRIVAVGTTALRLLETSAAPNGDLAPFDGKTNIFITPGYQFRAVDLLMTNFHLPRSTLFMLVAAFSGLNTVQRAYKHAVGEDYRFYSYGDACLLHPAPAA